jgi:putative membrane protein
MNIRIAAWLLVFVAVLAWSSVNPHDRTTWWLEVIPAIIGLIILAATRRRFPLTPLLYTLILLHAVILMVGGHYTYAEVPMGDWIQSLTGGERNNYDKLGHFAQGFVPAVIARELFIRHGVVNGRAWRAVLIVSVCLAFSAFYELVEWWAALVSAEGAEAFLGTQGYEWDTQSDMMWALGGAIIALLVLARLHDRHLHRLGADPD